MRASKILHAYHSGWLQRTMPAGAVAIAVALAVGCTPTASAPPYKPANLCTSACRLDPGQGCGLNGCQVCQSGTRDCNGDGNCESCASGQCNDGSCLETGTATPQGGCNAACNHDQSRGCRNGTCQICPNGQRDCDRNGVCSVCESGACDGNICADVASVKDPCDAACRGNTSRGCINGACAACPVGTKDCNGDGQCETCLNGVCQGNACQTSSGASSYSCDGQCKSDQGYGCFGNVCEACPAGSRDCNRDGICENCSSNQCSGTRCSSSSDFNTPWSTTANCDYACRNDQGRECLTSNRCTSCRSGTRDCNRDGRCESCPTNSCSGSRCSTSGTFPYTPGTGTGDCDSQCRYDQQYGCSTLTGRCTVCEGGKRDCNRDGRCETCASGRCDGNRCAIGSSTRTASCTQACRLSVYAGCSGGRCQACPLGRMDCNRDGTCESCPSNKCDGSRCQ